MFKFASPSSVFQTIAVLTLASGSLLGVACDVSGSSSDDDAAGGATIVTPPHGGTTGTSLGGATSTSHGGATSAAQGGANNCTSDPPGPSFGGSSGPGFATTTPSVGMGTTDHQYDTESVTRNGVNYTFIANGWGPNFKSQSISWSHRVHGSKPRWLTGAELPTRGLPDGILRCLLGGGTQTMWSFAEANQLDQVALDRVEMEAQLQHQSVQCCL